MLNFLKNIGYAFLIVLVINQIEGMQNNTVIYNDFNRINTTTIPANITLVDLAIEKICEQIKLACEDKTLLSKNSSEIIAFINERYFQNLPLELIERIKNRFLVKYNPAKISLLKKCIFFAEPISLLKTSEKNIAILSPEPKSLKNYNLCIYNYESENKSYYNNIRKCEFLPNGNLVAANENCIFVIDKNNYEIKLRIACKLKNIRNIIAVSDNKIVIALGNKLKICNLTTYKIKTLTQTKNAHVNGIISVNQLSNEVICTNGYDRTLKIWNLNTGELLDIFKLDVPDILKKPLILPNDNIVCHGYFTDSLYIYNVNLKKVLNIIKISEDTFSGNHQGYAKEVLINSSNNIITSEKSGLIKVWDIDFKDGKCIKQFPDYRTNPLTETRENITSTILLNEKIIAFCSVDSTLKTYNMENETFLDIYDLEIPLKKLIKLEDNTIAAYDDNEGILYFFNAGLDFEDKIINIAKGNDSNDNNRPSKRIKISQFKEKDKTKSSDNLDNQDINEYKIKKDSVRSLKYQVLNKICSLLEQTYGLSNHTNQEFENKIHELFPNLPDYLIEEIRIHFYWNY